MDGYMINNSNYFKVMQRSFHQGEATAKTETKTKACIKNEISNKDFSSMLATEMKRFS